MSIKLHILFLFFASMGFAVLGCYGTLAPPVRSTHYGTPGRLKKGDFEAAGAMTSNLPAEAWFSGGPQLGYAFNDRIAVEAGADLGKYDYGLAWTMGYGGIRMTPLNPASERYDLGGVSDLEIGAGFGAGGALYGYGIGSCLDSNDDDEDEDTFFRPPDCSNQYPPDDLKPLDRFAGGGYAGVGLGYQWPIFSHYLRLRYQLTGAVNVPVTNWITILYGVQWTIYKLVHSNLGIGLQALVNKMEQRITPSLEIGLSIVI